MKILTDKEAAILAGNESAFGEFKQVGDIAKQSGGVTIRDYFAAKAMQGIVGTIPHLEQVSAVDVAIEAYEFADAMLVERAKVGE